MTSRGLYNRSQEKPQQSEVRVFFFSFFLSQGETGGGGKMHDWDRNIILSCPFVCIRGVVSASTVPARNELGRTEVLRKLSARPTTWIRRARPRESHLLVACHSPSNPPRYIKTNDNRIPHLQLCPPPTSSSPSWRFSSPLCPVRRPLPVRQAS